MYRGEGSLRSASVATQGTATSLKRAQGSNSHKLGWLSSSWRAKTSERPTSPRAEVGFFFMFFSKEVKHEIEPQEWAENRVSISFWPSAHASATLIRTTSQEHRGMRDGRSGKGGSGGAH